MSRWFIRDRGRVLGPFTRDDVVEMIDSGQIKRYHECSTDRARWKAIDLEPAFGGEAEFDPGSRRKSGSAVAIPVRAQNRDEEPEERSGQAVARPSAPAKAGGKSMYRWIVGGIVAVLIFGAAATVTLVFLLKRKPAVEVVESKGVVSKLDSLNYTEQTKIRSETVGLIIAGFHVKSADGEWTENPVSTGSGFVISPAGKIITNKHVVENLMKFKDSQTHRDLQVKNKSVITPKIWIFFGRENRHECEVVHMSPDYDLAILDIKSQRDRFLALCSTPDGEIPQLKGLSAVGFPGSDRSGRKKIEGINALQQRSGPYIQHTFAESDFRTSLDTGDARKTPIRMKVDADPEAYYFVHGANTAHGNSGGPLLCSDGTAVGINTLGLIQEKGQNYALTLNQLRREIDAHAEGVVWRKHPE